MNLPAGSADFEDRYSNGIAYLIGGPTQGDIVATQLSDESIKWHLLGTGKIDFLKVIGGELYTVQDDGLVSLLNAGNGETLWSLTLPKGQGWGMLADGNELYVPGDNLVQAFDLTSGHVLWSGQTNGNRVLVRVSLSCL